MARKLSKVRIFSAAAVLAWLLAACAGSQAGAKPSAGVPVRVAANHSSALSGFAWVAYEAGIYHHHGLDIDLQPLDPALSVRALIGGTVDGAVLPSPQAIAAKAAGTDLTIVSTYNLTNLLLVAQPQFTSVEQLRSKVIGVTSKASANAAATIRVLRKSGLEPDRDYQILQSGDQAGYQGLAAQMVSRNVDAAGLDPDIARKLLQGPGNFHSLLDMPSAGVTDAGLTLVLASSFVKQQPDTVQRVVDSLIDAVHYAHDHKAETEQVFKRYYEITDQADLDATYEQRLSNWSKSPLPSPDQFVDIVEALVSQNPAVQNVDLSTAIDRRFVEDAVKRGLTNY